MKLEQKTMNQVSLRFYEELNDYLPRELRKVWIESPVEGRISVGEKIQSLGIPLQEVDLVLINEQSRGFDYLLQAGDRISVYPVFETFDIAELSQVRDKPLRQPRFICDVHLGRLCKYLRMMGWDTHYSNQYVYNEILELAQEEKRILLSRNSRLIQHPGITHAWWVRSANPLEQIKDLVNKLDLAGLADPFTRCIVCNGLLEQVEKQKIQHRLEERTTLYYNEFFHCLTCNQIYWKGSHYENMIRFIHQHIQNVN